MRLIGMFPYVSILPEAPLLGMLQAKLFFMKQGQLLRDVPGDGNCTIHAVSPLFAAWFDRPTTAHEIRIILVTAWRFEERCAKELDRELKNEIAVGKLPATATADDLLAVFSQNGAFLPPILVAMATHFYTHKSVHVYGMPDGAGRNEDPMLLYDEDGPADWTVLYSERHRHVCPVLNHPQ